MPNDLPAPPDSAKQLLDRVNELIRLQQLALLGPEKVLDFAHLDHMVRLHLPLAYNDVVQRRIVQGRTFYEAKQLAETRRHLPADPVVVDAGANIGNHTVYFALVCGARLVHAFEPMRVAFATLRRNIALNGLTNVVAHNKALGARDGSAEVLRHPETNTGATALSLDRPGAYPVTTIDSLGLDRCDLIKIDVEGSQLAVLDGATATLARCRPLVWVELRRDHGEYEGGEAKLRQLGYRVLRQLAESPNDHLFAPI
jgi:FkbM family methyltransferase